MIYFKTIKWKNVLSTGNYFTEMSLCEYNNTLIVGENGSGKSTLLDALCFVLFGKAFRNINKPSLVNSINNKDCLVEIEFDIGNKSYRIVRGIKPNVFEIYLDNVLLNQDAAVRDYQEYLEKFILKMNYKSFTQIVILGSASFVPFMQLSASDRRSIIEDLLDIQIFSTMNSLVKERLSVNKENLSNKKHDIESTNQIYELQKKHIEQLKKNNEHEIERNEEEIRNNMETISLLSSNNESIISQVEELQGVIVGKIETENVVKKINKLESQIENNLTKYKKDISFFEKHDDCPTCRQSIDIEFKKQEVDTLKQKVGECESGLKKLEEKLNKEQFKLNSINETQKVVQSLQVNIATNNTSIIEINKYISKLQKQIESLRNSTSVSDKEENELSQIKNKLKELSNEVKKLIEEKTYLEVSSNLLKDTGIKTKIIKQYLPIINKQVNKYLSSLDFFVNFNLDESFKETIKSRHRDDFIYNNFSEGEKSRIDLSLLLTWRAVAKLKNSVNTNLLILDEVFDSSLDSNGTEYLMNILHVLDGVNLFVISHKGDVLHDKFSNVIKFEKIKNFSRVMK